MDLTKILFLDIETVGAAPEYAELPERIQELWDKKSVYLARYAQEGASPDSLFAQKAGIYAEFGKIVCISAGLLARRAGGELQLRVKSFNGENEKELLAGFAALLESHFYDPNRHFLCGHNIREFDIPYLCRRMLVNGLKLSALLDIGGRKPWELKYLLDTMEMWKFGDFKHFTSLDLLSALFDVPSPKDEMHGSQVHHVYWQERDIDKIRLYCEKDVVTTAQVFLRLQGHPLIPDDNVIFAGNG